MKKISLTFIIALIVSVTMISCTGNKTESSNPGVKYFRHLQFSETPYDIEKGIHSITEKEAETINSYKFTYDESNRLLTVEYVRNNVLLGNSSMGASSKIVYEYDGNKAIKSYYDKDNQRIESSGVYSAEYSMDENGFRTGLKFYGKDGEPIENRNNIHSWTWFQLPDGMVRELRYNLANEEVVMNPFCPFYELRFTYNDQGYVTRMANYKADTLYNCTAENCGDIGVSYFLFEPNEKGDLLKFSVFNVSGQMSNLYSGWSKRINKVDENGYVMETAVFDQDDEYVSGKSVPVRQFSYDEHGAVVEIKNMDKDRVVFNSPESGVAITKYQYDEVGNRTETLLFDKDGAEVKQ